MSDEFIPLNQSTPVGQRWQSRNQHSQHRNNRNPYHNNRNLSGPRNYNGQRNSFGNRWGNNSQRNSSYGSDSNNSFDKSNIDAYLHPSMLQDPWAPLRNKLNRSNQS